MAASLLEMDQTREREGEEREEEDERRRRRRRLMTSSSSASLLAATTATATTATPTTATTTTATNLTKPSVVVDLTSLHSSSSHPKQPLQSHIEHTTTTTHSGQFTLSLKAGPAEEIHVPLNLITALNKALQLQQQQQQQQQQQLSPSDSSSQHSSTSHTPAPIQHPSAPSLNTATCITPTFNSSNLHPPSPPQLLQQDQDKPRIQLKNSTTAVSSTPSPVLPSSDPILPPPHDTNSSPPPTARSPFTGTSTMPAQSTALTHTTVSFSSARNPSTIKLNASAQQDSEGGNSILVDEVEDVSSDDPGEEEEGGEIVDLLVCLCLLRRMMNRTIWSNARTTLRSETLNLLSWKEVRAHLISVVWTDRTGLAENEEMR
ncbi:hypothetical protein BC830DRAFT_817551 [Chytriomyces sp. MP71]|nr:hypothetical protein BC830DRAFT_817551 [Chytriomyces sp. MP71]